MFSSLTTPISETARYFGSRLPRREAWRSIASTDRAGQQVAEQIPACAVEFAHLDLFERRKIGRRCIELDAGQRQRHDKVLEVRGLLHDVLARQLVAALLDDLRRRIGKAIAGDVAGVRLVAF